MIGNDIIDLNISFSTNKSGNLRFLKKIFTEHETEKIRDSKRPELLLWQFWSMKEAAYKAHQRAFGIHRKFNPKSYSCFLNSEGNSGIVEIDEHFYSTHTEITSNYIHTGIYSENSIRKIYFNKSFSERDLLENLALELSLDSSCISISKDSNGIPSLHLKKKEKILAFSLSHHGNFTAFIIPLIKS